MKKGIALVHPYLPSLVGTIVWENNGLFEWDLRSMIWDRCKKLWLVYSIQIWYNLTEIERIHKKISTYMLIKNVPLLVEGKKILNRFFQKAIALIEASSQMKRVKLVSSFDMSINDKRKILICVDFMDLTKFIISANQQKSLINWDLHQEGHINLDRKSGGRRENFHNFILFSIFLPK